MLYVVASHLFWCQAVICNNDLDFGVNLSNTVDEDVQLFISQKGLGCYGNL